MDNNNFDFSNLLNNLNSGNIPDDLKNIINNFKNNANTNEASNNSNFGNTNQTDQGQNQTNTNQTNSSFNIDMDMLLKMKNIMDKMNSTKDDPRTNLLLSLKPYLKESRKDKVEQYVKLFSMSKVMDAFNSKRRWW